MRRLQKILAGILLTGKAAILAAAAAQGEVDWARLNIAARERAKTPIRAGVPGVRPFWNAHAKAFVHPPAFEFQEVDGATAYHFVLMTAEPGRAGSPRPAENGRAGRPRPADTARPEAAPYHSWTAAKPWLPIPADIWDSLPPGYYTLKVDGSGERTFYRAAVFRGPYPAGACGYSEAAQKVYAAVYNMPQVQGWKTSDDPPNGYDLYCYPAKILSSMIRALVRYSTGGSRSCATADAQERVPPEADEALRIARKMADWLIAHSQPAEAPLAHFPPTYWGDRRDVAVKNAGQNMLLYPAHAALAYLDLAEAGRAGRPRPAENGRAGASSTRRHGASGGRALPEIS